MSDQTTPAQVGLVGKIGKALNSGKAWLLYAVAVVGAVYVLHGYWRDAGFPVPVFKHQMTVLLDEFGKQRVDPVGLDTKRALDRISALTVDLTTANGRNEALQVEIRNLNKNVDRLVAITDKLYDRAARANISSSAPIPTTAPPQ